MTYEAREISSFGGAPISFYEIEWGNTVWRYTSAETDQELTINSVLRTFTAIAIKDSGMTQGGSSNNDLTITAPFDIPLTDLFHSTPPSDEIRITVRRAHEGDPEAFIHWKGFLRNVKRAEDNTSIEINGFSILAMFESQGLRLAWTRGCPHILYDGECRVDPEAFGYETEIVSLTGNSITVADIDPSAALIDGYFTGGYIEWEANEDGTLDRRGIMASTSPIEFVLLGTTYRLEAGMTIRLYPGCDLTTQTCDEKFNNLANYGGIEQMTGKNPFDGTAIV